MGRNFSYSADFDSQIGETIGSPFAKQYRNLNVRDIRSQIKTLPSCGVSTMNPPKLSIIFVYGAGLTLVKRILSRSERDLRVECRSDRRRFESVSKESAEKWFI